MAKKIYDVAIIGAGPAGMMAAVRARECGAQVIILEKKQTPGLKLLMTGKERCNITQYETDAQMFIAPFGKEGRFLLSALSVLNVDETIAFFNRHKVKTKLERGGRVFPESDTAKDVQQLFLKLLQKNDVTIHTRCAIKKIVHFNNHIEKIITTSGDIEARSFIIATGGLSYPETGSTGDGYTWAKALGHTVITPEPALTPIIVQEKWVQELEGLSLRNVSLSAYQNNKKKDERFGEALFTRSGLSGPIVLDMSKQIGLLLRGGTVCLVIDFKPALDFEKLDKRIMRDLEAHPKKAIKNMLAELLPKNKIPCMLKLTNIDPEKKANVITREERKTLRRFLKEFPLTVKKLHGFDKAIVTAGGIALKEIDPNTMHSRVVDNCYFAGEILNLDGPTGGYNLQVCWSTGYCAGESAAQGTK